MSTSIKVFILTCLLAATSCVATTQHQLTNRLAQYEAAMRRMDFNGVAANFAETAELATSGTPSIRGRENIRTFLQSFSSYKIQKADLQADSTIVHANSARQLGTYSQRVTLPSGETIDVSGRFAADWVRDPAGRWLLAKMETIPTP